MYVWRIPMSMWTRVLLAVGIAVVAVLAWWLFGIDVFDRSGGVPAEAFVECAGAASAAGFRGQPTTVDVEQWRREYLITVDIGTHRLVCAADSGSGGWRARVTSVEDIPAAG